MIAHPFYAQLSRDIAQLVQNTIHTNHWQWVLVLCTCIVSLLLYITIKYLFSLSSHCPLSGEEFSVRRLMIRAFAYPVSCYISGITFFVGIAPVLHSYAPELLRYWSMCLTVFTAYIAIALVNRIISNLMVFFDKGITLKNANHHLLISIVGRAVRVIVSILILLVAGDQLGLNVTALIAGAGVLGLAFAFASQDMIANIFGTVIVVADTPFSVGDYIQIDGTEGEVISIGFRSTRLKMKSGYFVVVPNKTAANAVITNVTRRPYIRHDVKLGLVYDTTPEKMQQAIDILQDVFSKAKCQTHELPAKFLFSSFDAYALTISVTAWFHSMNENGIPHEVDYWEYAAWASNINFEILKRFNEEELSFAFPTNVTYMIPQGK